MHCCPLHPQAPPALMNFPAYARLFFALLLYPSLDPLSSYCKGVKLFLKEYSHFPLFQFFCGSLFGLLFSLITVHTTNTYRISSYSFCGNHSFLNLEIQRSQYIRPKVTVYRCAETIQGRKLYEEIRYDLFHQDYN